VQVGDERRGWFGDARGHTEERVAQYAVEIGDERKGWFEVWVLRSGLFRNRRRDGHERGERKERGKTKG
jgi:hypothetical protein